MGKIKKGLASLALGSILAVSGCSSMIRDALISEEKPVDMRNSPHVKDYRMSAEEKAKSDSIVDLKDAIWGYGCICETEEVKKIVSRIIKQSNETGIQYDLFAQKVYKMCEK